MPEYEFFNEDGEYRSVFFKMSDAPPLDSITEVDGEMLRRVASMPGVSMGFQPFVSHSLARNDRHATEFDSEGRPCFSTERSVRDLIAKNNADPYCTKMAWG